MLQARCAGSRHVPDLKKHLVRGRRPEPLPSVIRCHGPQGGSFPAWAEAQEKAEAKLAFEPRILGTQCHVFSPSYLQQVN